MTSSKRFLAVSFLTALTFTSWAFAAAGKSEKPIRVSHGSEVKLEDLVVKGKTTVFDFTSEYCPPCVEISPYLDKLHSARADVVVVKIDINRPDVKGIDWKSPVAQQYKLRAIPYFKVFGPDGKLQAEGDAARKLVTGWFE